MRPDALTLSRQWRHGSSPALARRRTIAGLALSATGAMGLITLYQLGVIKRLPEPPLPFFDAEKIVSSPSAYDTFSIPDGLLGLGSYAVTAALAALGGEQRATHTPWIPLALAGKLAFDLSQAIRSVMKQWRDGPSFCSWCLLAAGASFIAAPLALPETRTALEALRKKRKGDWRLTP